MAATVGSLFDTHQTRIEEIINKNVEVILPALDPAWRDTFVTSQDVGPASMIGRDMQIHKIYMGSFAGVIEQGAPRDDFSLFGDNGDTDYGAKFHLQSPTNTWPDPTEGPNATPYRLTVPMRSMNANIGFTIGELQAEATPAFLGQVLAPKLRGFAQNWAHTLCNYWYVSQNSQYRLCAVSNVSSVTLSGGIYTFTFQPDNQAVDRFWIGQRIDFYPTALGSNSRKNQDGSNNRYKTFVAKVDELNNIVTVASEADPSVTSAVGGSADAAWQAAVANTDVVVYANSDSGIGSTPSFTGIAGINSWLVPGDTASSDTANVNLLLGSEAVGGGPVGSNDGKISVQTHPEFKSFLKKSVGTLTESKLRRYVRRWHAAKNKYNQEIDCFIAPDGVWMHYEDQKIGRELIDRTNRPSSLSHEGSMNGALGGDGAITFHMDGRTYKSYTSTYVESGTLYGIKKGGGNWKRYVPPSPAGAKKDPNVEAFIPFEFVGSILTGTSSNRLPYRNSSARPLEMSEMPGQMRMQLVPDQPAGLKLTGLTEARVYSDQDT